MDRIITCFCCFLCAFPFFIIASDCKNGGDPIGFWTGDTSLKGKVQNVEQYNGEMSLLYKKWAFSFILVGFLSLFHTWIGIVLITAECTLGIYLVWRSYKKILRKYSQ